MKKRERKRGSVGVLEVERGATGAGWRREAKKPREGRGLWVGGKGQGRGYELCALGVVGWGGNRCGCSGAGQDGGEARGSAGPEPGVSRECRVGGARGRDRRGGAGGRGGGAGEGARGAGGRCAVGRGLWW